MILLNCLVIFACIFTGGAQDRSLDNLIADIFKPDETPSSSTTITPVVNPKDPSSNSGTGTDKGTESGTGSAQYKSCGDQKECVPRWLCANDTINTSGDGIIDIQIGTGSQCENYLDVCCDLPNKDIVDGLG